MNQDEFLDKLHFLSVQAGMSQRYHQRREEYWAHRDLWAKASAAVFAVFGAVFSGASLAEHPPAWMIPVSFACSIAASISAVILNVLPYSSWERDHRELYRQWTDQREAVDDLEIAFECEPKEDLADELRRLTSKAHRICGQEKEPVLNLAKECQQAEENSRKPAAA